MPALSEGTKVAGRYILRERIETEAVIDTDGVTASVSRWYAVDEVLHRPVTVWTIAASETPEVRTPVTSGASAGFPPPRGSDEGNTAGRFLRTARQAAALSDPRFLRVLDALSLDSSVAVVTERVAGYTVTELLATGGPLPIAAAVALTVQVCRALGVAHDAGLTGLEITPDSVLRTELGPIKIDRLVLARLGDTGPAAVAADTRAAAALLYAAVTGRWPGRHAHPTLPPAPLDGDRVATPRQVRAGVPADLDDIVDRALNPHTRHPEGPLVTPRALGGALAGLRLREQSVSAPAPAGSPRRIATSRVAQLSALAVLVGGLGLAGVQVFSNTLGGLGGNASTTTDRAAPTTTAPADSTVAPKPVPIAGIHDFDPDGDGTENPGETRYAIDGNPATAWYTMTYYRRPELGGLKPGVGLVVDLGRVRAVRAVDVLLVGSPTSLQLRTSTTWSDSPQGYVPVAAETATSPRVHFTPSAPLRTRYLLLWLTSLPQIAPDRYRGGVAQISVSG